MNNRKAIMKKTRIALLLFAILMVAACGQKGGGFDPRDTVQVPECLTGEDSIAYIENTLVKSPISAEDLLSLQEVHTLDSWLEQCLQYEDAAGIVITYRDSCALRMANRFMRMHHLVDMNGDAMDKLQWAVAVNAIIDSFCAQVPEVGRDTAIDDITRLFNKIASPVQMDLNLQSYVMSSIDYYRTFDAYRRWLERVPDNLKEVAKEEYVAWHDLNEARFAMWRDVSLTREWYSMKPMQIEFYYQNLSENRRAELAIERDIILEGKLYKQKGKTVTKKQWEQWIKDHSRPEDYDDVVEYNGSYEDLPSDSTVVACTTALRQTFSRWLAARQALAAALPEDRGTSYDNLTADIHSRLVGKLPDLLPFEW